MKMMGMNKRKREVKTRIVALLTVLLMVATLLAGCGSGGQTGATGATDATGATGGQPATEGQPAAGGDAEAAKYGGTLYFGYPYDLTRPNYIFSGNGPANFCRELTWDTLLVRNEKSELEPRLAESYEISADGLVYTLHLRPGVKWQDGAPFSADDVVFYFDFYEKLESVDKSEDYSNIIGVDKVDDLTVKLTLKAFDATFADVVLTDISFIPKHIWQDIDPTVWDEVSDLSTLIGIGPFKLAEKVDGEYLRFEPFEDYWAQKPYLDGIVWQVIPDAAALALAFESKQVQFAMCNYVNSYLPLNGKEGYEFSLKPTANLGMFQVNHADPLLSKLSMRKAVSFLIDRQSLIQAQQNGAAPLDSGFTPVDQYYNPAVADPEAFEYNVDKAIAILEAEGWLPGADGIRVKDGQRLEMEVITYTANDPNAVIMQDSFKKAGIDLTYTSVEVAVFTDLVYTKKEYQLAGNGSGPAVGPVAAEYSKVFTSASGNYTYENPLVTQAFAEARATTDAAVQKEKYEFIQKTVTEERAEIFTWNTPRIWGTNSGLNIDGGGFTGVYPPWVDFSKVYFEK
jgi:peptide/nickel transport system substrate-binding protein